MIRNIRNDENYATPNIIPMKKEMENKQGKWFKREIEREKEREELKRAVFVYVYKCYFVLYHNNNKKTCPGIILIFSLPFFKNRISIHNTHTTIAHFYWSNRKKRRQFADEPPMLKKKYPTTTLSEGRRRRSKRERDTFYLRFVKPVLWMCY